jgi:hypothetical protein
MGTESSSGAENRKFRYTAGVYPKYIGHAPGHHTTHEYIYGIPRRLLYPGMLSGYPGYRATTVYPTESPMYIGGCTTPENVDPRVASGLNNHGLGCARYLATNYDHMSPREKSHQKRGVGDPRGAEFRKMCGRNDDRVDETEVRKRGVDRGGKHRERHRNTATGDYGTLDVLTGKICKRVGMGWGGAYGHKDGKSEQPICKSSRAATASDAHETQRMASRSRSTSDNRASSHGSAPSTTRCFRSWKANPSSDPLNELAKNRPTAWPKAGG